MSRALSTAVLLASLVGVAHAQSIDWPARLDTDFRVVPNITFMHGGGWTGGTREGRALAIQAYLALTTAFLPSSAGLDRQCPGADDLQVAAVVNWYGITDVNELLDGPNRRAYAVAWLGSLPHREEVARRVSPLTYVRAGLPPVLTIHGDADPTVPYAQAERLQRALNDAASQTSC